MGPRFCPGGYLTLLPLEILDTIKLHTDLQTGIVPTMSNSLIPTTTTTVEVVMNNPRGRFQLTPADIEALGRARFVVRDSYVGGHYRDESAFPSVTKRQDDPRGMVDPRFCGELTFVVATGDEDQAIRFAKDVFAMVLGRDADERLCDCCGNSFRFNIDW